MSVYIYALIDPRTDEIRYVGKTIKDPAVRLSEHVSAAKYERDNYYVQRWITKMLREDNIRPEIKVIEEVSKEEWKEAEQTWISYFREEGCPLCNIENGGEGPGMVSEETKTIISQKARERYKNPENHPWYGRNHTEETRRKISKAHKGKVLSEEHKNKIAKAFTGENNHFFGKSHSEETKKQISEAKKGQPNFWQQGLKSEEELGKIRQKMSDNMLGENNPMHGHVPDEKEREEKRQDMLEEWSDPEARKRRVSKTRNIGPRKGKYKGVIKVERKSGPRWQAFISDNGKTKYLGTFDSPEDAALAYDKAAIEAYKGDCYLNLLNR